MTICDKHHQHLHQPESRADFVSSCARDARAMALGRNGYGFVCALLCHALTGAIALAAASAADPLPCRDDHALYRPTTNEKYELEFLRSLYGTSNANRAGILRYRGKVGVFEYEFAIISSVGFGRSSLIIIENSSAPRDPEEDDNKVPEGIGPGAHMIELDADFGPSRGTWADYLLFPDLTSAFREWFKELAKHPDHAPPEAWKLVPCRDDAKRTP